jgi:hypothetical protein
MTTATVKNKIEGKKLEPYVEVLLGASGITEEQARICLLYTLCTYREDLDRIPILAIMGMTGTGKSALLEQIILLVNSPTLATGSTFATIRDEMGNSGTYIIDEADRVSERLLLHRTDSNISTISHNIRSRFGWTANPINVFGATILARRDPFRDAALRNRAIVIRTQNNPGDYKAKSMGGLEEIARDMKIESLSLGSGRVQDTWTPLLEIAKAIDDPGYEEAIAHAIEAEQTIFRSGQEYEPSEVVMYALDKLTWDGEEGKRLDKDIGLPELTETANEIGDVKLIKRQVEELLMSMGFKVTFTHGTKFARANTALLEKLLQGL